MRKWINIVNEAESDDFFRKLHKLKKPKGLEYPRPEDLELIDQVREKIRYSEGCGGQCHEVSEWILNHYGWERFSGTYCTDDGEPVCTTHFWNELPDGTILDSTADQLGEDVRTIRIIHPSDPLFKRYTSEWMDDWHPHHPDYDPTWTLEKRDPSKYTGKTDSDRENELRAKNGGDIYWYLKDRQYIDAYKAKEKKYEE